MAHTARNSVEASYDHIIIGGRRRRSCLLRPVDLMLTAPRWLSLGSGGRIGAAMLIGGIEPCLRQISMDGSSIGTGARSSGGRARSMQRRGWGAQGRLRRMGKRWQRWMGLPQSQAGLQANGDLRARWPRGCTRNDRNDGPPVKYPWPKRRTLPRHYRRRTKGLTGNPERRNFQIGRLPRIKVRRRSGMTPCSFTPPRSLPLRWQRPFRQANARCPARRF